MSYTQKGGVESSLTGMVFGSLRSYSGLAAGSYKVHNFPIEKMISLEPA
jgi:hypothetical protein